jgi:hypothetical protein
MPKLIAFLSIAGVSALAISSCPALAITSSTKLVYDFTYSSQQQITARDSSDSAEAINTESGTIASAGGSGASHYQGSLTDKGTITVDIVRQQTDGGLVVDISEQGQSVRRAPPATCVVYGNTNVICDPNKTVYTEEYTLLRFLGTNFVDPSQLDANKHWSIVQNGSSETVSADYSINSNNGGNMQIGEKRTIKEVGAGHLTSDVQTKIAYDFSRAVPTSVDEYVQQHVDSGINGTSTNVYQTTLSLASSSSAAAAAGP